MSYRVKWAKAPRFQEVAETLGVPTTQVAAVVWRDDNRAVVWSTDEDESGDARAASLERDADGILRVVPGSERQLPGFFAWLTREGE